MDYLCGNYTSPAAKASERIINIKVTVLCKKLIVTFCNNLMPIYAPIIADKVAQAIKGRFTESSVSLIFFT